jgi:hypothetical protein
MNDCIDQTLTLTSNLTTQSPDGTINFKASGGTIPYVYSVNPGGAGGTIDAVSGIYVAPDSPGLDVITVTDRFLKTAAITVTVNLPLAILPVKAAIAQNMSQVLGAVGGTPFEPSDDGDPYYEFSLVSGPGYVEDSQFFSELETGVSIVQVKDAWGSTATMQIRVGNPLELFCDVLQTSLNLPDGRVWIWDQKINEPTDEDMFIVVRVMNPRVFGNNLKTCPDDTGLNQVQETYWNVQLQVEVKSRNTQAIYRLNDVVQALRSTYSMNQQAQNSFKIFPVIRNISDLSSEDGAAIPYRFALTVTMQYTLTTITAVDFYDTFGQPTVTIDP